MLRTHTCGELKKKDVGKKVKLCGWADTIRQHGKLNFIDLRDRTGTVQVVGGEEFKALSEEDVVYIKGLVKKRQDKMVNPKIRTGSIEIEVKELKILNKTNPLPLPVNTEGKEIDEKNFFLPTLLFGLFFYINTIINIEAILNSFFFFLPSFGMTMKFYLVRFEIFY